jgi:hypothetical protein
MKLGDALLLRADLQKKAAGLRERIVQSALIQKGDKPKENAEALIREVAGVLTRLRDLIVAINRTNLSATLGDGRSMTEAVAERDRLRAHHGVLTSAAGATRKEPERYSMKEIKWVSTVDPVKLQKQADDVAGKLRELNARIQEANWRIELEE